jgi:UDP-N-acetylmuramate--alanine ligase
MEKKIYMIGIGGIGMSALAQLYVARGHHVSGSDRTASPVTNMLQEKGVHVVIGQMAENIPVQCDMVVYSAAVHDDNSEYARAKERGMKMLHYFEALGEVTRNSKNIVITGTHGKTTTTAMVAKILIDAGEMPTVIAGSILSEYDSNFVAGRDDLCVIEGCEYERHFLHLSPYILGITNIELDHTDYYKSEADLRAAFDEMMARVPENGTIVMQKNSGRPTSGVSVRYVEYGDVTVPALRVPGEFNRENARLAKALARAWKGDIPEDIIDASLAAFSGTWRRFEYKGKTQSGAVVYDDYAHHPTAVEKTLLMAREEFPNKKLLVVFHPHLYSRTRDFFDGFARALAVADEAYILPVFAAREAHDPAVSSEKLAEAVTRAGGNGKHVADFAAVETLLHTQGTDTLCITMGAGDVYKVADRVAKK